MYLGGMIAENGRSQAKVHRWIQAGANAHISREPQYTKIPDLTRFPSKAKYPDGQWIRKPLANRESNNLFFI